MALWQVRCEGKYIHMGEKKRRLQSPGGCNQPFKNSYWCPKKHWFRREPCPFENRRECDNFAMMCGAL